jgi:hypothetical protein
LIKRARRSERPAKPKRKIQALKTKWPKRPFGKRRKPCR